jgi:5-methylcytosine-specific restriction endonuclease McrA
MKKIYCCKDCGNKIARITALIGQGRCNYCAKSFLLKNKLLIKDIIFCCMDCGGIISRKNAFYHQGRCKPCSLKFLIKDKLLIKNITFCCRDCGEKISYSSAFLGNGRCKFCCKKGKLNARYIDGYNSCPYPSKFNEELKLKIRIRDNYKCQICVINEKKCKQALSIHHIDYNKENCKEDNLISLCDKCHLKTGGNRDYWYAYCTYLMENK